MKRLGQVISIHTKYFAFVIGFVISQFVNYKQLEDYFRKEPDVLFAILFGSYAKKVANKLSDVDIAVYLTTKVKTNQFFDKRLKFMADCPITGSKDIIILNESSPLLAYEVVAHGKPVFVKDKKALIDFTVVAYRRYFDTKELRKTQHQAMAQRIKEGRLGYFKGNDSIKVAKIREFSRKIARIGKAH